MKSYPISFSSDSEHCRHIRQALHIDTDIRIVDLSTTLVQARQRINPFTSNLSLKERSGATIVIDDFPLTGKTCLAYQLACDWLNLSLSRDPLKSYVLILEPENQDDWTIGAIETEIAKCASSSEHLEVLLIIDNIEQSLSYTDSNIALLRWLLTPSIGYHKLLLYTKGAVLSMQAGRRWQESLDYVRAKHADALLMHSVMRVEQSDLVKLEHAFLFERQGQQRHIPTLFRDQAAHKEQPDAICLSRGDHTVAHLLGLLPAMWEGMHDRTPQKQPLALGHTKTALQFRKQSDFYTLLTILRILADEYKLGAELGFSTELVGIIFLHITQSSMSSYETALSTLAYAEIITSDKNLIHISELWLQMNRDMDTGLLLLEDSIKRLLLSLDVQFNTAVAWLHYGLIHLMQDAVLKGLSAIAHCVGEPIQTWAVEQLAKCLMPLQFMQGEQPAVDIAQQIQSVMRKLAQIFDSSPIAQLPMLRIDVSHDPWRLDSDSQNKLFDMLLSSFAEAELRDLCFELGIDYDSLEAVGRPAKAQALIRYCIRQNRLLELTDMCVQKRPAMSWQDIPHLTRAHLRSTLVAYFSEEELRQIAGQLGCVYDDLEAHGKVYKARELVQWCYRHGHIRALIEDIYQRRPLITLRQLLVDTLVSWLCTQAREREHDLWEQLDQWQALIEQGSQAEQIFLGHALTQVSLKRQASVEQITGLLGYWQQRNSDEAQPLLYSIARMLAVAKIGTSDLQRIAPDIARVLLDLPAHQRADDDLAIQSSDVVSSVGSAWDDSVKAAVCLVEAELEIRQELLDIWLGVAIQCHGEHAIAEKHADVVSLWLYDVLAQLRTPSTLIQRLIRAFQPVLSLQQSFHLAMMGLLRQLFPEAAPLAHIEQTLDFFEGSDGLAHWGNATQFDIQYQNALALYMYSLEHIRSWKLSDALHTLLAKHQHTLEHLIASHSASFFIAQMMSGQQGYAALLQADLQADDRERPSTYPEAVLLSFLYALRIYDCAHQDAIVVQIAQNGLVLCACNGIPDRSIEIMTYLDRQGATDPDRHPVQAMSAQRPQAPLLARGLKKRVLSPLETEFIDQATEQHFFQPLYAGRIAQVIPAIEHRLATRRYDAVGWYIYGIANMHIYNNLSALDCFQIALSFAPQFTAAYVRQAEIFRKLERYDIEVKLLEQALVYHKAYFDILFPLAQAYKANGDISHARQYFEQALECAHPATDEYYHVLYELIQVYSIEKNPKACMLLCWKYLQQRPFEANVIRYLIASLRELETQDALVSLGWHGNLRELERSLLNYMRARAKSNADWLTVISLCYQLELPEEAWTYITRFLVRSSSTTEIFNLWQKLDIAHTNQFFMAIRYIHQQDYEQAVQLLEQVLSEQADDGEAYYYLASAYYHLAQIQFNLDLDSYLPKKMMGLALYQAHAALFCGVQRAQVHELTGDIMKLFSRSNPLIQDQAARYYEEAFFDTNNVELLRKMIETILQIELYQLEQRGEHISKGDMLRVRQTLIEDILSIARAKRTSVEERRMFHDVVGQTILALLKLAKHNMLMYQSEHGSMTKLYFEAQKAFRFVIDNDPQNYTPLLNLADVYWEWHYIVHQAEQCQELLEQAITCWEKAQQLTHAVMLPRSERTVREKAELMIGRALKRLRDIQV